MTLFRFAVLITCSCMMIACKPTIHTAIQVGPLIPPETPLTYCDNNDSINTALPILASGFGFDIHNTRNQPHSNINASNVGNLALKYTLVDEHQDVRRGSPAATDQVLYFAGVKKAFAFNRTSGCAYWSFAPNSKVGDIRSSSVLLVDGAVPGKRILIIGTSRAHVIAIDAKTGQQLWTTYAGNNPLEIEGIRSLASMITGGLQYANGKVYVPISSHEVANAVLQPVCCGTNGALRALDASNGNILWAYETATPAKIQNGNITKWGPNGVSIWSNPLIDLARGQILVGTSQNFSKPVTANADAIVALDINTGTEKWIFKGTAEDYYNASCGVDNAPFPNCDTPTYDFDMITPILTAKPAGGEMIVAADKAGYVYAINPANGVLFWKKKIGAGGLLGGIHWGMAVDSTKVYAGVSDFQVPKTALLGSTLADLLQIYPSQVPNATPGIYALNLDTGAIVWEKHTQHSFNGAMYDSIYSAAVSVSNDLLFAGALDGTIKAFKTSNGDEVWSYDTDISTTDIQGRKGKGGTIDSVGPIFAGDQLILNSGYSTFNVGGRNEFQAGPGNGIFVFDIN